MENECKSEQSGDRPQHPVLKEKTDVSWSLGLRQVLPVDMPWYFMSTDRQTLVVFFLGLPIEIFMVNWHWDKRERAV